MHTVCRDSIKMESGKDSSGLPFMVSQVALVVKKVHEVAQLCPTLWDPMDCSLPGSFLNPWNFPGQNTGVGYHFLLQGIFPTQGSNPGLPHCRHTPYHLSYQGSTCLQHRRHETWVRSLGWEDPLEKGMATHSSILAWWVPWTEEPGGLQITGSQRVGHDWRDLTRRKEHLGKPKISAWAILLPAAFS